VTQHTNFIDPKLRVCMILSYAFLRGEIRNK